LVELYVKTACILHNFLISKNLVFESLEELPELSRGIKPLHRVSSNNAGQNAISIRDKFAEYFLTPEGQVSWQFCVVNRGLYQS
jgi:hypothetical protein